MKKFLTLMLLQGRFRARPAAEAKRPLKTKMRAKTIRRCRPPRRLPPDDGRRSAAARRPPMRRRSPALVKLEGAPPEDAGDSDERRSVLPVAASEWRGRAGRRSRRRSGRRARERLRLHQTDQRKLCSVDDAGRARPEGLPVSPARQRHSGRSAAADQERRRDAAQHPRDAERQLAVQRRPAGAGDGLDEEVRQGRRSRRSTSSATCTAG